MSPESEINVQNFISENALQYRILNSNVSRTIERTKHQPSSRSLKAFSLQKYFRFNEITEYMKDLAQQYGDRVSIKNIGKSHEKRALNVLLITNGIESQNKRTIFIDAGIHAREWIAPATALYVIHQLVENFEENSYLLKNYNWMVLPVVNPDGYEYTHGSDRFWRKTRKPYLWGCKGVDGNRNFDFHWGEGGASSFHCSETYKGPTAFSEPETLALRNLMLKINETCRMYLTLHSYGNYLLYPWGYTS